VKHLVIAGTGRAGTSFLVYWLGRCGLDTGSWGSEDWHVKARAGFERRLTGGELPYVVKDPWLHTYLDDVDPAWIDVLVLPMRNLESAARSRVDMERQAINEAHPGWVADVFGAVPGGMIHSLSLVDQARTLAVGFYELLFWALRSEVPVKLLEYPRLVVDAEYVVAELGSLLPDRELALAAHAEVAWR